MKSTPLLIWWSTLLIGTLLFSPHTSEWPIETSIQSKQAIIALEKTQKSVNHILQIEGLCKSHEYPKITSHKTKQWKTSIQYKCVQDDDIIILPNGNSSPTLHFL